MDRLNIGVVVTAAQEAGHLTDAAESNPNVVTHRILPEQSPDSNIVALVVDAPIGQRGPLVSQLMKQWRVPILVESPLSHWNTDYNNLFMAEELSQIYSLNPLHYHLPTQRLNLDLSIGDDQLESIFAAWRFQHPSDWEHAFPQLVDYVCSLAGAPISRLSAIRRSNPQLCLALLRFANNVIAHVEIGAHLPSAIPLRTELLVECFCQESTFQCRPDAQAVDVDGAERFRRDWSSQPAFNMVSEFVDAVRNGRAPQRTAREDFDTLQLCRRIAGDRI